MTKVLFWEAKRVCLMDFLDPPLFFRWEHLFERLSFFCRMRVMVLRTRESLEDQRLVCLPFMVILLTGDRV